MKHNEIATKLATVRALLKEEGCEGLRLRGSDWFAWATAGASSVILLATDYGVAEVLITQDQAFILTDTIESERLRTEEVPGSYEVWQNPWQNPSARERFVQEITHARPLMSDRPRPGERPLSPSMIRSKRILLPSEVERYRALGRDAAAAMTSALLQAKPEWSGYRLAAQGSAELWQRGIHPVLTLVGDERRLPLYRHPTASGEKLGARAMLVFCARRHGLYANLTRFVYFREPGAEETRMKHDVAGIEAEMFAATRPGASLGSIYEQTARAYGRSGYEDELNRHHQGGPTGYLAREEVMEPESQTVAENGMAFAWNPSLTGTKIEDTVLLAEDRLDVVTLDEHWPTFEAYGRLRPDYLVRP